MNFYNIDDEPLVWGEDVIRCDNNIPYGELNILLLERMWFHEFLERFDYYKHNKFIILHKSMEDYFLVYSQNQEQFQNYISTSNNFKVIWDIHNLELKNFHFHPKVHIQNFYNNSFAFPCDLYLYGNEVFENQKNKKRIGFHLNGVTDYVRVGLYNELSNHENFFYTINDKNYYNIKNKIKTNYTSKIYSNQSVRIGISYEKYIDNFLCQNINSEMELVYETFLTGRHKRESIKWTEKTLKHLYLGKPFIHTDPLAHKLMGQNGFTPYNSLFTVELLDLYEKTTIESTFGKGDFFWKDKLIENIYWLLNMSKSEWEGRIEVANHTAKENRERVFELIFKTNLHDFIRDLF